jgi:4-amino-4-deoxy-L-arabinose transferase-like glycosyltransferase
VTAGDHRTAGRAPILAGLAVGAVSFAYLLALPPTLNSADESFLLYGAKRILQGHALYRDFFDFITPGSFYLYAAAFRIGGVSITSARVTTALLNAVSATCTYLLALHVASAAEAILAALLVTVACIPAWNMASQHWTTTAFVLATAAVLLAERWRGSNRARLAAAGAVAGLAFCTNQGRGALVLVWLALAVPALTCGDVRRGGRVVRNLAWTAAGVAAVCAVLLGYAVWRSSIGEMLYATHEWTLTNYRRYNVGVIGWGGSLWPLPAYHSQWLVRLVPIVLGVESIALPWAIRRHGVQPNLVRALLLLLALLATASILYFPDYVHVVFVTPFVLVVLAGLVYRARPRHPSRPVRFGLGIAWAVLLALLAVKGARNARLLREANPVRFETAFGTLAGSEWQAALLRDLRVRLPSDRGATLRLFAYPTDAWLYLALPADNPTPFALLRPVYNTPAQIETALERLRQDPPAGVVVNTLYPKQSDPVLGFLREHYRDVGPVGAPGFFRLFAPPARR